MTKKTTEIRNSMIISDEDLLILDDLIYTNSWIPTKRYAPTRAIARRMAQEVERRGLTPLRLQPKPAEEGATP